MQLERVATAPGADWCGDRPAGRATTRPCVMAHCLHSPPGQPWVGLGSLNQTLTSNPSLSIQPTPRVRLQEEPAGSRSFFSELLSSMSGLKFSRDGRYMLARDFMSLKIWDVHMEAGPVATYPIHEHLRGRVCVFQRDFQDLEVSVILGIVFQAGAVSGGFQGFRVFRYWVFFRLTPYTPMHRPYAYIGWCQRAHGVPCAACARHAGAPVPEKVATRALLQGSLLSCVRRSREAVEMGWCIALPGLLSAAGGEAVQAAAELHVSVTHL